MASSVNSGLKPGKSGFGRIGKLIPWHHVARKYRYNIPLTGTPNPPGHYQEERHEKYRVRRFMLTLSIIGFKIEIEREHTVKMTFIDE